MDRGKPSVKMKSCSGSSIEKRRLIIKGKEKT